MRKTTIVKKQRDLPQAGKTATQVLSDYHQWLLTNYGQPGTYHHHAKSFLKRFNDRGSLMSQLDTFAGKKSITGRSILNRFKKFLLEKKVTHVTNDLKETTYSKLPTANAFVKLYMATSLDRLRSKKTLSTYATILNDYFQGIGELRHFQKLTVEQFVFRKKLSPFTSALYSNVLKSFCRWAIDYRITPDHELSVSERKIKDALADLSVKSLRDVLAMKVKTKTSKLYHKESLTKKQRDKLMAVAATAEDKAIVSLMAYNGLRPVEVERLQLADIDLQKFTLAIHGKGRDVRHKETIVLFTIVARHLRGYLRTSKIKKGKLFPRLTYPVLHEKIQTMFTEMGLTSKGDIHFTPHSLRHTAGQLLYDDGIPLEFIQRTLRHTSMESTLVYARKAIERSYFKTMRHHW
ncbi:MAG TPA: tyrosine-type recombinase/integrase [Cyclobacteriaceae bacterium]|jgi:integrase/recombinase XerD|nr:tyrosine-type recombinase/integrase [Cyclobacteriaceae bacterium]